MGTILVGTASWTDKSLLRSGWYPEGVSTAEERLRYYASKFPLVEVDSTYYFPPTPTNAELWVERTPERFVFNVKAFSLLTRHPTRREALPKGVELPEGKTRLYPDDLAPHVVEAVWDQFLSALEPLHGAGKLGTVLFQFPPWFTIARKNKHYVVECARRSAPLPICVEFRNATWMSEENRAETLDFLEGHGLPYVVVDMPQGFRSSVPPVVAATADLAVVRFHGHNADEWESGSVQRRFRYLYSRDELAEWAPRLTGLAEEAGAVHVLLNNCYEDYAQRNASDLMALLAERGAPVTGPEPGAGLPG